MATEAKEDSSTNSVDEADAERAELEKAFEEAAAAREGTPEKSADPDAEAPGSPPKDDEAQPGESVEDQPGVDGAAAEKAPDAGSEDDVWTGAPEQLRKAREQELANLRKDFDHRFRSLTGRLSAADRELARLRAGRGNEGEGRQSEERKPLRELLESDELKAIGRDYPDLDPLLKTLGDLAERVDGVDTAVGEARTRQTEAALDAEEKALDDKVGNWRDLARHKDFQPWLNEQPRHIREATARNWDAITDAAEAADVFERFAAAKGLTEKPKADEEEGSGAPSRRQRQASSARPVRPTGPAAAAGEPEELEGAFALAARKADAARGIK